MAETKISELVSRGLPSDEACDFKWFASHTAPDAHPPPPTIATKRTTPPRQTVRRSRPSDEGHGTMPGAAVFSPSGGLELGTLVHDQLAQIEWLPAALPPDTHDLVRTFLSSPAVHRLFAKPTPDAMVWRERAMSASLDGTIVSAQMDRVVVTRDEILLIDFKTDQSDLTTISERYTPQMHAYLRLLAEWSRGRHQLTAVIATVRQPAVIEIEPP